MADPFTIALLAGGGMVAAGQIQEGRVAAAQGKFAEQIGERNQQALERQRVAELEAAKIEEGRAARKEKIVKAMQRVTVGKSGVGLAGATMSLLADTAAQFSMERNLILRRGTFTGQQLRFQGQTQLAQGRWARSLGKQAQKLSYVKAGGSILSSVGMAGMMSPAAPVAPGSSPYVSPYQWRGTPYGP